MDNKIKAMNAYVEARTKKSNIKENEKIVLECKTDWCYFFALNIPGADIKAHEQVILELKNPESSYFFAMDIPGANVEEHFKVIYNSGDKGWLYSFIKLVNYKGTRVEEWLPYI